MVSVGDMIGAYRVVAPLGTGGMGQVWVAEHALIGRRVAIKLLRPELSERTDVVERFFDEAKAAAQIEDPGIVQVHDFGRHDRSAYFVMEYLGGEVLSARLGRTPMLPVLVASRLIVQTAMTMAVAHGRGIVHRDLKPDNLFVVPDPAVIGGERVKVLDFGIAKLLVGHDAATRTQTGAILGTPMYMSPEQCRSASSVDHRTDIYALGCVLFHMLCGRPPFVGESSGDLIAAHLVDQPVAPSSLAPSVPPGLDAVVARCLAKAPGDRFSSMSELARAAVAFTELSLEVPSITPVVTAAAPSADVRTPKPSNPIAFLTTLGTGAGEAKTVSAPQSRLRRTLAIVAAISIAAVVTIVIATRTGDDSVRVAPSFASPATEPAPDAKQPEVSPLKSADPEPAEAESEPPTKPPATTIKPTAKLPLSPHGRHGTPTTANPALGSGSNRDRDDGAYEFDDAPHH
jgi:eukaryotic-like serine/threonine-protein kinase